MITSGLSLGFTFKELKRMDSVMLMRFIAAYNEVNTPADTGSTSGVRDATQEDIHRMLM